VAIDGSADAMTWNPLVFDSFETGISSIWEVTENGSMVGVSGQQFVSGTQSARCVSAPSMDTQAASFEASFLTASPELVIRRWLYLGDGFPTTSSVGLLALFSLDQVVVETWLEAGNTLIVRNSVSDERFTLPNPIPSREWVHIDMAVNTSSAAAQIIVRIDEEPVLNTPMKLPSDFTIDAVATCLLWQLENFKGYQMFVDDVLVAEPIN
jgi:hypothetical protein